MKHYHLLLFAVIVLIAPLLFSPASFATITLSKTLETASTTTYTLKPGPNKDFAAEMAETPRQTLGFSPYYQGFIEISSSKTHFRPTIKSSFHKNKIEIKYTVVGHPAARTFLARRIKPALPLNVNGINKYKLFDAGLWWKVDTIQITIFKPRRIHF